MTEPIKLKSMSIRKKKCEIHSEIMEITEGNVDPFFNQMPIDEYRYLETIMNLSTTAAIF